MNDSLGRKMDASAKSYELGSMTLNADARSMENAQGILKPNIRVDSKRDVKRGKKASVSKEGRENVVTNIKIKTNESFKNTDF